MPKEFRLGQQSLWRDLRWIRASMTQVALPPGSTANEWANIILIRAATATSAVFPVTAAGLTAALAAASSGDMVWIPPSTLADDFVIPAGVGVTSMGNKTILEGQVTLNANTHLYSIILLKSYNEAGTVTGVIGPASGTAYLDDTSVKITNTGAGDVHAVAVSEGGNIEIWVCDINGNAAGAGDGYGIVQTSGDAFVITGRVRGSTAPFSGTVQEFSFVNDVQLLDSGGALKRLYPADATGVAAAIAAAASGDIIDCPSHIDIAFTSGITVPVSVTIRNMDFSFSGFAGNAVTLSNGSTLADGFIFYDGSGEANATGVFGNGVAAAILNNLDVAVRNATTNIGVNVTGVSQYNGVNIIRSRCFGGFGTNGIGLQIGDYVYVRHSSGESGSTTSEGIGINFVGTVALETLAFSCWAIATSDGNSYGGQCDTSKKGRAINCFFNGDTADMIINSGAELEACGNNWDTLTNNGTLTYLLGDRGAYSVEDYHAEDIEDSQETRHTPVPVAQGDMMAADGNPYWRVLTVGAANEVLQSDGTDPAWIALDALGMDFDDLQDAVHDHTNDAEGGSDPLHEEVHNEDHTGACDGARVNFITANEYEPERTQVYLSGVRQRLGSGNDYTEDDTLDAITFDEAPLATDVLLVDYVTA